MGFTMKQDRNGTNIGGGEQNSAQHGPYVDAAAVMSEATSAGNSRKVEARDELFMTPQGNTPQARQVGGDGSMWEWDSGLAVNEQRGEA